MNTAEAWIARLMVRLGQDMLIPAAEETVDSIWVDDELRVPVAGYYVKRRIPLKHRMLRDGKVFLIEFERNLIKYRLRAGCHGSYDENGDYVMRVMKTLLQWIDDHIVTWSQAFAGFTHETSDGDAWWRVLRLPPDATRAEIDDGYKRAAFKVHPDRGGSAEDFKRVRAAYERAISPSSWRST